MVLGLMAGFLGLGVKAIHENVQISRQKYPNGRNKSCDDFWRCQEENRKIDEALQRKVKELFPDSKEEKC